MAAQERRKDTRMRLSLPVRAQGHDAAGLWQEMTATDDTGYGGCAFNLKRPVVFGQILQLDLPLPKNFRQYDTTGSSYRSYALVRDVSPLKEGARVGTMFLGKTPPKEHEENPAGLYLLPTDPKPAPKERRKYLRLDVFMDLMLRRPSTESPATGAAQEQTVAENLCKRGARVMTSLSVTKGDVVMVEELGGSFRTRAEIRNVYVGKDNVSRLNLYFLDEEVPDRLVSAG